MRANEPLDARHVRVSGILLILGLFVQGLSFLLTPRIGFRLFLYVGGGFLLSGVVVFLYSLLTYFVRRRGLQP